MIHDIEILQQLLGAEPDKVDAVGVPVITDHVDIANARLTFPGACVANLTASRVSATPLRKFRLFQRDAYFSIDFLAQKAMLFRRVPSGDGGKRIEMQQLETDPEDALATQLDVFVHGVRGRGAESIGGVTGAQAAAALRTALRVIDAMPIDDWNERSATWAMLGRSLPSIRRERVRGFRMPFIGWAARRWRGGCRAVGSARRRGERLVRAAARSAPDRARVAPDDRGAARCAARPGGISRLVGLQHPVRPPGAPARLPDAVLRLAAGVGLAHRSHPQAGALGEPARGDLPIRAAVYAGTRFRWRFVHPWGADLAG